MFELNPQLNQSLTRLCRFASIGIALFGVFAFQFSFAASNQNLVYQGRIIRPDGTVPNSGTITFTLSLYSPTPSKCLLYSETQTVNMTGSSGMFSLLLGAGTRTDGGAHTFSKIFVNGGTLSSLTCASGTSFSPASTDDRSLLVSFDDSGSTVQLSELKVKSVPFALQAAEIGGYGVNDIVKIHPTTGSATTFTTAEMAVAKVITGLACGNNQIIKYNGSTWACAADDTGGAPADASYAAKGIVQFDTNAATSGITVAAGVAKLSNTGVAANSYGSATKVGTFTVDAQGRITSASDVNIAIPTSQITQSGANNGEVLKWNGTNWVPSADLGVTSDASYASKGIVQFNTDAATSGISVAAGVATVNTGTGANQIVKLDGTGKLPAVDGSALTGVTATGYSGVLPIANGGTNSSTALNNDRMMISSGGKIVEAPAMTNGQIMIGSTGAAPTAATLGQSNGISITNGAGTISIATNATSANTASTIVSRDASGNFNAGTGSFSSTQLRGSTSGTLTITVPTTVTDYTIKWPATVGSAGTFLTTDASGNLSWGSPAAISDASYAVKGAVQFDTNAATSGITVASGVASVNTGTGANQIVKLDGSAKLPAVDGSALTGLTATQIPDLDAAKITSGVLPIARGGTNNGSLGVTAGGVVYGDGSKLMMSAAGTSGQALLSTGAGAPAFGTLGVAAGGTGLTSFSPNALVMANGTGAGLISMTCSLNEILKWNGTAWACGTDNTPGDASYAAKGVVQFNTDAATSGISVASGVATVNTGTGANQIVKLDGTGKLPAVDGSALTGLTASQIPNLDAGKITSGTLPIARGGTNSGTALTNNKVMVSSGGAIVEGNAFGSASAANTFITRDASENFAANEATLNSMKLKGATSGTLTISVPTTVTDYTIKWPNAIGAAGSFLTTDASGNLSWGSPAAVPDGSYTVKGALQALTDAATSGLVINSGVVNVNTGTGANQIVKLDGTSKLPAVDGSALTNLSAGNISSGTLPIARGGTGQTSATAAFDALSPLTTKGDVVVHNGTNNIRLPVGTNNYVLTADSAQASGLKWAAVPTPGDASFAAKGIVQGDTDAATSGLTFTAGVIKVNSGTGANQIVKLDGTGKLPAIDGSALTNITATSYSGTLPIANGGTNSNTALNNNRMMISSGGAIVEAPAMTNGQIMIGSTGAAPAAATLGQSNGISITNGAGTISIATNATSANTASTIVSRDASGNFAAGTATFNATKLNGSTSGTLTFTVPTTVTDYTIRWPGAVGAAGSFLTTDASGNLSWGSPAAISDASYAVKGAVQFDTNAATSGITVASGVASVNTGTGANQIVKLDGTGKLPAVDGSALTGLTASQIPDHDAAKITSGVLPIARGGTNNGSLGVTAGGVVYGDGSKLMMSAAGTSGQALLSTGAGAPAFGTLGVAAGGTGLTSFSPNALVMANGTGAGLISMTCSLNEILKWNGTAWACGTDNTPGDASYAAKGIVQFDTNAATSGITVASGVASVNTGTGANQIVKLDGTSKLPAVDGSALTNISAGNISSGTLPIARGGTNSGTALTNNKVMVSSGGAIVEGNAFGSASAANTFITRDASENFAANEATLNSMKLKGSTSGTLTISVPTTVTDYTIKWPNAVGAAGSFLTTDASGNLSWGSPAAISDASYAVKGAVQFDTNASTSGITVASGVASVNTGTGANQIVKLDGTGKLPAVDGSALTGLTSTQIPNLDAGKITTGVLPIARGGTNNGSLGVTAGGMIYADGSKLMTTAAGTSGQALISAGAGTPAFGTLGVAGGGTGLTSFTTGDIPYASGATTISKLGIGANGTILTSNGTAPAWSSVSSLGFFVNGGNTVTGTAVLGTDSAHNLEIETGGTTKMTILANGDVGIGTSSPAEKLDVAGNVIVGSGGASLQLRGNQTGTTATHTYIDFMNSDLSARSGYIGYGATNNNIMTIMNDKNDELRFGTNATDRLKILGTGEIAIGNITPSSILDINGAVTQRGMAAPSVSPAGQGRIYFDSTANKFKVSQNGGAYADLVPGATADASYASKGIVQFDTNAATSGISIAAGVASVNTGTGANQIVKLDGSGRMPAVDGSNLTNLDAGDISAGVLPIARGGTNNGSLGVTAGGVTYGDGSKLMMSAAGTSGQALISAGAGAPAFGTLGVAGGGTGLTSFTTGDIPYASGATTISKLGIGANGTILTSNGTAPAWSSVSSLGFFVNGGNTVTGTAVLGTDSAHNLEIETGGTTRMTVDTSGRVGIGETSPQAKLHITDLSGGIDSVVKVMTQELVLQSSYDTNAYGEKRLSFYKSRGTNAAKTAVQDNDTLSAIYSYGYDGNSSEQSTSIRSDVDGAVIDEHVPGRIVFTTENGTAMAERMTIRASGKVGIGTSDPKSLLHVSGGIQLGNDTDTCNATKAGTFRYTASNVMEFCNASAWTALSTGSAVVDASYAAKGIVRFNTDAATSGISVASGVATVNFGTGANQIVKLDASSKLPAVDGSALTNLSAANISSGVLPIARGGTNNGSLGVTAGGMIYADGTKLMTTAAGTSGQALISAGAGAPTFGTLGVGGGGTGLTAGTSGGIPYFSAANTMASSAALATNGVVLGGGAGAAPTTTAAGTANQVLRVPAGGGAPAFGAIDISQSAAVTGTLAIGNGGTGVTSLTPDRLVGTTVGGALSFVTCAQNQVISFNASGVYGCYNLSAISSGFQDGGNTFTATAKLGTNSNHDLEIETFGTTKMTVKADGKVGIGTTAPDDMLDVRYMSGAWNLVSYMGGQELALLSAYNTSADGERRLAFYKYRGTWASPLVVQNGDALSSINSNGYDGSDSFNATGILTYVDGVPSAGHVPGRFEFHTDNGTTNAARMVIKANGDVGIGTTSPSYALSINRSSSSSIVYNTSGTNDAAFWASGYRGALSLQSSAGGANAKIKTIMSDAGSLKFGKANDAYSAETTHMTILDGGNVGIGTTAPGELLEVNGTTKTNALKIGSTATEKGFSSSFTAGSANQKMDIVLGNSGFGGTLIVSLSSGWNGTDASGVLEKTIGLVMNAGGTINSQNSYYSKAHGPVANNFAISDVTWDAANSVYRIQIVHRLTTANSVFVSLKGFHSTTNTIVRDATLGAVYTTDTTVFSKPYVNFIDNVGIGNSSPSHLLSIRKAGSSSDPALTLVSNAYDAVGNYVGYGFQVAASSSSSSQSISAIRTGSFGKGDLVFLLRENPATWADVSLTDEKMRLTDSGRLGIGSSGPAYQLHIRDDANAIGVGVLLEDTNGNADARSWLIGNATTNGFGQLDFIRSSTTGTLPPTDGTNVVLRLTKEGRVGINGVLTPTHALQVAGTAGLSTGTAWTNTSDIRLKDIDGDYEYGLNEILKLNTVRFHYKKNNPLGLSSEPAMTGFIAQEVQKVIPDAVTTREDGYLELNVDPIHWATVNAVQDLHGMCKMTEAQVERHNQEFQKIHRTLASVQAENEKLKQDFEKLKKENATMKKDLEAIKKRLGL